MATGVEPVLQRWGDRLQVAGHAHYRTSDRLHIVGRLIESATAATSVAAAALAFSAPWAERTTATVVGFLSIVAATLVLLLAVARPAARASEHRNFGSDFFALRREVEVLLALDRATDTDIIDQLALKYHELSKSAPLPWQSSYRSARKLVDAKPETRSIPASMAGSDPAVGDST